jgi:Flp pilus assembly protein TadG
MLRPLIQRPQRLTRKQRRERGITLALVALAIFSIIALAGLSIDVGTLYQASAEAQRAADAAALAAARTISVSGITGAAAPTTDTAAWQQICGGATGVATETAVAAAQQNTVGGAIPASITVTYSVGSSGGPGAADCSGLGAGFGVNPVVTVQVTQSSLPTYFSRIWGRTGSSASATASAEAFNPSGSGNYASGAEVVPVQPRCVKPWMVPNYEPWAPSGTCTNNCTPFVDKATGTIQSPGILPDGSGVIGETFWLIADCRHNNPATCTLRNAPEANVPMGTHNPMPPNLDYLPAQTSFASSAIPADGSAACSAVSGTYAQAIAGCDQSTQYQCGKVTENVVDLTENPGITDTSNGAQCLIHQSAASGDIVIALGQDTLQPFGTTPLNYPFQIQAGTSNPLTTVRGNLVTSSTSIASLPIYDSTQAINPTGTTTVTVIGFLQVFINFVDENGNLNVTVMNVAGCGNAATGTALTGTSPVPVRLITQP